MNREETRRKVLEILGLVLKREFEGPADVVRKATEGWDSLTHIEIMFAIEDEFGVEFSEDELATLASAERIVDAILAKRAA